MTNTAHTKSYYIIRSMVRNTLGAVLGTVALLGFFWMASNLVSGLILAAVLWLSYGFIVLRDMRRMQRV